MNLKDKRTKRVCAASASAAVIVAGGVVLADFASATDDLGFGPNVSSATIVNVDPTTADGNAALAYGLKVTGAASNDADPLRVSLVSGPGSLYVERAPGNGTPTANTNAHSTVNTQTVDISAGGTITAGTTLTLSGVASPALNVGDVLSLGGQIAIVTAVPSTSTVKVDRDLTGGGSATAAVRTFTAGAFLPVASGATALVPSTSNATSNSDNVYVGATTPGTYSFRLFKDRNGNGAYDSGQDATTPAFTLTVKDVRGATSSDTSDDVAFGLTAPSTVELGQAATAMADPHLTTSDTRGIDTGHGNVGALGYQLSQAMTFTYAGSGGLTFTGGVDNSGHPTFDGTFFKRNSGVVNAAGTLTTTPTLAYTGAGTPYTGTAATTTATSNLVTAITLGAATGQDAKFMVTNAATGAAAVREAADTITYKAQVTVSSGSKSGKKVYFDFTQAGASGIALTDLTVNGSAVPSSGLVETTTDADGYATAVVKSAKTANGNAYTIQAASNNVVSDSGTNGGNQATTATYQTPTVTSLSYGNYGLQLGTTANLTAKILDQWGQAFTPAGTAPQALLHVDGNDNGTYSEGGSSGDYDTYVNIFDGGMSTTVVDSSVITSHTFRYKWDVGATHGGERLIKWLASPAAGSATLDSLDGSALPITVDLAAPDAGNSPATNQHALIGTVKDGSGVVLPYASFTLSGSPGVYFYDVDNAAWVSTITARTDVNGKLQVKSDQTGSDVKVLFTRTGSNTVTVNAGGKTATATFSVAKPGAFDGYTLNITSQSTMPSTTVIVSGRANDIFGNPVDLAPIDITVDDITYGVLSANSATTNGSGDYSVTYTTGSKTGKVFLSASLHNALPTIDTGWAKIDGLSLTTKNPTATGNITIAPDAVSLSVSKTTLVGGGNLTVTGNTRHDAPVDVYFKVPGGALQLVDSVTADGNGDFSVPATVTASGSFIAKTATATSQSVAVKVVSTAKISARVISKRWIRVSVSGGPTKHGKVVLWQRFRGGKLVKLATVYTNSGGASWKIKSSKGTKIYRATYTSDGASTSAVVSVSITR